MKVAVLALLAPASAFMVVPAARPASIALQPARPVLAPLPAVAEKASIGAAEKLVAKQVGISDPITKDEIRTAVRAWCDGIVEIGKVFSAGGDYKAKALEHIERHYAFGEVPAGSKLLFKPTLAHENNFRSDLDGFQSYFTGDGIYSEDAGFAIKPWSKIRFDVHGVFMAGPTATVSGVYYFTPTNTPDVEVKVEYTFQFIRSKTNPGTLKICLHHSSVPFSPK